jgi:carboxylesterase type B
MSVNLQMTAYGGRDDGLFSAVAGESNSFGSAKTVEESQYQYDALVDRAGCKGNKNTLECLRNLKIEDLAKANVAIPNQGRETKPLFMYSTVIDGDFMRGNMYGMLEKGNFVKVPSIFGGTTNEGTVFTPTPMNNYNDVNKFLKDQFPKYIDAQLAEIDHWYPKAENFGTKGEYWRTAANAWGEIRYNCPGVYLNNVMLAAGHKDTWHYHYAVASDADAKSGNGATHVRDSMVLWGTASGPDKEQVPTLQAYWASFIRNHDPNKQKAKDAPTWDSWTDPKGEQKRLRFDTDVKKNRMENLDTVQKERCEAMRKIGKVVGQ